MDSLNYKKICNESLFIIIIFKTNLSKFFISRFSASSAS